MQHFKNKYITKLITMLIVMQVVFLAPSPILHAYTAGNEDIALKKVLDEISANKLSSKELRKQKKEERRRLKKEQREQRRSAKRKKMKEKKGSISTPAAVAPIEEQPKSNDSTRNQQSGDTIKTEIKVDSTTVKTDTTTLIRDSSMVMQPIDSMQRDTTIKDTTVKAPRAKKKFIDEIIHTTNADSMIFDMKNNKLYLYKDATMEYGNSNMKAAYINLDIEKSLIDARGEKDTAGVYKKPIFSDGGDAYDMDSIGYNLKTKKALIKGGFRKEGEGFIHGELIKKTDDKTLNIRNAKYTTCDCPEPHFYLASSKAQLIQGKGKKNIVIGPSWLVLEGVPLPLVLPFGFFPLMSNRNSGIIIPEFGEESQKGFFLRGGGYYFAFNDYLDATIRGGIYTQGSWELSLMSSYRKRYKFNGNIGINYSKDIIGEKGSKDYQNINNYRINWSHTQDPKFLPSSTFSASVNFSSSTYNKLNGNIEDYITAQTNSSISYSKNWVGKPLSLSTNLQHSQNNRDSTVSLSMPNVVFNVSKIYPFKRRNAVGKQRWYEKIGMSYTGTFNNSVNTKQNLLFKKEMFDNMKYGFNHQIPINTSFTVLKYLNITPGVNYQERWYFNKINKEWDPNKKQVVISDTTGGFYRVYNYSASLSLQTILYGMYQFKGDGAIKAIRHMMTPSISFSYAPNFGAPKFGYYKEVQSSEAGAITTYSPFEQGIYGVPGNGQSASLSFSLSNTLEMKVRSKRDTSGVAKIKLLESLNFGSGYNFLADSMNLSPISITARTTLFKSLGINASATLDPYKYTTEGIRTKQYALGRITNASLSFGYSFRSVFGHEGEGSGTGSETLPRNLTPEENRQVLENNVDPNAAVSLLTPEYYNFSIPWNLSLNYNLSYSHSGNKKTTTQTVSYNGSITITKNWGLTFSGGLNLNTLELTPGTISIDRDLHCWQMGFTWVPIGFRKSWNFNIKVKSAVLQDLKFKKSSGYLDNYY
ncbi:MAG: putative LPS assembly protein LptD [Rikenellaceae bacterium]